MIPIGEIKIAEKINPTMTFKLHRSFITNHLLNIIYIPYPPMVYINIMRVLKKSSFFLFFFKINIAVVADNYNKKEKVFDLLLLRVIVYIIKGFKLYDIIQLCNIQRLTLKQIISEFRDSEKIK